MRVSLLTIGDELLIGQVLNSNAQWIGSALTDLGLSVTHHLTVGDNEKAIREALDYLRPRADVILVGGGLGPTHDDITLEVFSRYTGMGLEYDQDWITQVEAYFKSRGRVMSENNKKQALLLKGATRIDNDCGTAAGQAFTHANVQYFIFPGVPHEMKSMMNRFVLPRLKAVQEKTGESILKKTLLTTGLGESLLAQRCDPFVLKIKSMPHVSLAFLPSSTLVRLRLQMRASKPEHDQQFKDLVAELQHYCGKDFYGFEPTTLEETVVHTLTKRHETVALAESCSGGYATHRLTRVPGASVVVRGAVIPYQTDLKTSELNVPAAMITEKGVVSEDVARTMAEAVRKKWATTYGISTTGYLGPTGGDTHAEVGTVWVAVATPTQTIARPFKYEANRERGIERTAQACLDLLRRELL